MRFHRNVAYRVHHKGGPGSRHLLPRKPVGIIISVRGRCGVANLLRLAARRIVGVHDGDRVRSARGSPLRLQSENHRRNRLSFQDLRPSLLRK